MALDSAAARLDDRLADTASLQRQKLLQDCVNEGGAALRHFEGGDAPLVLPIVSAQALQAAAAQHDARTAAALARASSAPSSSASSSSAGAPAGRDTMVRPLLDVARAAGATADGRWLDGALSLLSLPSTLTRDMSRAEGFPDVPGEGEEGGGASEGGGTRSSSSLVGAGGGAAPVGRYRVRASGRVEMEVNGVPLEIALGVPRQHYEQVVATVVVPGTGGGGADGEAGGGTPPSGEFVSLGGVRANLVASVDLDALLATTADGAVGKRRFVQEYNAVPRQHGRP